MRQPSLPLVKVQALHALQLVTPILTLLVADAVLPLMVTVMSGCSQKVGFDGKMMFT